VSSNLSPAQAVPVNFSVHGERGEIRLNAQIPTNDRGEATLNYIDSEVGTQTVEAVASVGGVTFTDFATVSWVPNQSCPMETVQTFAAAPDSAATLTTLRRFRDKGLTQTARGKRYTGLYYKFSSEAVRLMMFNPMLLLRSREIVERYKPVIESMVNSEQVTITQGDVEEIQVLLNSFAGKASVEFQQAIKQVCEDLRDPQVHAEFGITVIEGPKRELPAHHLRQTINRASGIALFISFLMAVAFCFTVARKPRPKAKLLPRSVNYQFHAIPLKNRRREEWFAPATLDSETQTDDCFGHSTRRIKWNGGVHGRMPVFGWLSRFHGWEFE